MVVTKRLAGGGWEESLAPSTADDIRPLTLAQVGRLASHIEEHLPHEGLSDEAKGEVVAARREIAEALGLVGYWGRDTGGDSSWRNPTKKEGDEETS